MCCLCVCWPEEEKILRKCAHCLVAFNLKGRSLITLCVSWSFRTSAVNLVSDFIFNHEDWNSHHLRSYKLKLSTFRSSVEHARKDIIWTPRQGLDKPDILFISFSRLHTHTNTHTRARARITQRPHRSDSGPEPTCAVMHSHKVTSCCSYRLLDCGCYQMWSKNLYRFWTLLICTVRRVRQFSCWTQ